VVKSEAFQIRVVSSDWSAYVLEIPTVVNGLTFRASDAQTKLPVDSLEIEPDVWLYENS
jgi:hypothetical protein